MRTNHYSPLTLLVLLMVAVLLIKVYQHNRLVYLTHRYQRLTREHAQLLTECNQLRQQHVRILKSKRVTQQLSSMMPLTQQNIVPLSTVLKGADR